MIKRIDVYRNYELKCRAEYEYPPIFPRYGGNREYSDYGIKYTCLFIREQAGFLLMEVLRFVNIILISHSRIDSYTLRHCDLQLSSD